MHVAKTEIDLHIGIDKHLEMEAIPSHPLSPMKMVMIMITIITMMMTIMATTMMGIYTGTF